jgi:hypothetical protein
MKPIKAVDVTIDGTGWQKELTGMPDDLQGPDVKTSEGRIAVARDVLEMIGRNLKATDLGEATITAAGISPSIYNEALAVAREPEQSARIATLTLLKTPGMAPESAFLLRGRNIIRILTFGRD